MWYVIKHINIFRGRGLPQDNIIAYVLRVSKCLIKMLDMVYVWAERLGLDRRPYDIDLRCQRGARSIETVTLGHS